LSLLDIIAVGGDVGGKGRYDVKNLSHRGDFIKNNFEK
jgi:hypothetical protein